MPKPSAGLLMYRRQSAIEVFLVHPGGPFWAKRDRGAWTIPKGQIDGDELPLEAAQREFREETGFHASAPFLSLDTIVQAAGKTVHAWAFEGDCDPSKLHSNTCTVEWPPRTGRMLEVPEIDRGAWFTVQQAMLQIIPTQTALIQRLVEALKAGR